MTRRQKDPLRPLSAEERAVLVRISRAQSDPASHVHAPRRCWVLRMVRATLRQLRRLVGARKMPCLIWCLVSTAKGWRRSSLGTVGDPERVWGGGTEADPR